MKRILSTIAVLFALLAWHTEVHASCVTQTIMGPGGTFMLCTTCCRGSFCDTICV